VIGQYMEEGRETETPEKEKTSTNLFSQNISNRGIMKYKSGRGI